MVDRGFDVTRRTIERDLNKLSEYGYPVFLDDSAQPNLWSMLDNSWEYQRMNIENMVALLMAKKYLLEILPDSLKDYLTKVTADCDRVLSSAANTNGLAAWALNHEPCDQMKQHVD
jgi:predicted DNA-binding transcriptional regulator YafY